MAVEGAEDVQFKSAVIATGSRPAAPPIPGIDHPRCIDSTGALELDAVPQRLRRARRRRDRRRVRVDLRAVRLGGHGRRDAAQPDRQRGRRRGRGAAEGVPPARHRRRAGLARDGRRGAATAISCCATRPRRARTRTSTADVILVATGRVANVEDIGLEAAGVTAEPRRVPVDSHMRTNVAAHLRGRRRRGQLAARAHRLPRGRDRGRERARARLRDRLPLDAALRLHRPGGRLRRPLRGAGARGARRRTSWSGRCRTRRSRARRCTATAPASSR